MKTKRILSLLMVLALCLSLLPLGVVPARAAGKLYADTNCDGKVDMVDVLCLNSYLNDAASYKITDQGKINADCCDAKDGAGLDENDSKAIFLSLVNLVALPCTAADLEGHNGYAGTNWTPGNTGDEETADVKITFAGQDGSSSLTARPGDEIAVNVNIDAQGNKVAALIARFQCSDGLAVTAIGENEDAFGRTVTSNIKSHKAAYTVDGVGGAVVPTAGKAAFTLTVKVPDTADDGHTYQLGFDGDVLVYGGIPYDAYSTFLTPLTITVEKVEYYDPTDPDEQNKTCDDYTVINAQTELTSGWYAVPKNADVTITSRVEVTGDVNLILCDGARLVLPEGIHLTGDNTLTVWGQEKGTGELETTGTEGNAGIGGGKGSADGGNGGTVIVYGGVVTATGGNGAAGIGAGDGGSSHGSLTLGAGCAAKGRNSEEEGWTLASAPGTYRYFKIQPAATVTFLPNDGTGESHAQTEFRGESVTLAANGFTRAGYTFAGWNTEQTPTEQTPGTVYADKASVTLSADLTLYAQWTAIPATAPTIDTQPQNMDRTYGNTDGCLTVAASATDGHKLSYQWYSNTSAGSEGGTAIDGATDASYAFPADKSAGSYYYYCVVNATRTDNNETAAVTSDAAKVTVNAKAVTAAMLSAIAAQIYTGSALTPTVEVKDGSTPLTSSDYTVAYSSNTDPGTATVTITGKGNYTGTASGTFQIYGVKGAWENGSLTATAHVAEPANALLIAAVYDRNGKQVSVNVIELTEGKTSYETGVTAKTSGYTCKLMVVSKGTCAPLCEAWSEKAESSDKT